MSLQHIVMSAVGLLTVGGIGGIVYNSTGSRNAIKQENPPSETGSQTQPVTTSPESGRSSGPLRSISSVSPSTESPKTSGITYRFSMGQKTFSLTCLDNKHPGSGYEGNNKVIICSSDRKQDSISWYSQPKQAKTECDWNTSKNAYVCTSPRKRLESTALKNNQHIKTREAIQIS
ncbi:hypothetical protein MHLP_03075 [Candidatus Mycoplasma haematolamae str. Purdue]|uniref:Uncharacterized protein n=1 Tax=Mycoplasma haematolamae (strain Purdue) TaxID=1212765 RepID=I7BA77_MYCHA|nr:hypothetical protein [Candidatus Mycoplasma haematolamae]AFO52195.1 hypothetical protein MHLP_03075 [Candidatus Mycoplasma haematolamae str. Purdue]